MVKKPKNLKISKIVILSFESILGYFWGLGVPQIIFFKNQDISNSGKTFSGLKIIKNNQIGIWQKAISAVTDTHPDRQKLSNYRIDVRVDCETGLEYSIMRGGITMIEVVWEVKIDGSC